MVKVVKLFLGFISFLHLILFLLANLSISSDFCFRNYPPNSLFLRKIKNMSVAELKQARYRWPPH